MQRFKPKFDDEENRKLDQEIDSIVTELTQVSKMEKVNDWIDDQRI